MRWRGAALLCAALWPAPGADAQLLANIRSFFSALPTFETYREPAGAAETLRTVNSTGTNITQAVHNFFQVPIDNKTNTWQVEDPSIGAGVSIGPDGAALLTRDPSKPYNASYDQAVRLGKDGLTFGADNVTTPRDPALGNLGVQALNIGPDGLVVNKGSPLNSSVQVGPTGLNISGNPGGSGQTHLLVRPNFRLANNQIVGTNVNGSGAVQALLTNDDPKTLPSYQTYDLQSNDGLAAGPLPFTTNSFGQPLKLATPGAQSPAGLESAAQGPAVAASPSLSEIGRQQAADGLLPQRFAAVQGTAGATPVGSISGGASASGISSSAGAVGGSAGGSAATGGQFRPAPGTNPTGATPTGATPTGATPTGAASAGSSANAAVGQWQGASEAGVPPAGVQAPPRGPATPQQSSQARAQPAAQAAGNQGQWRSGFGEGTGQAAAAGAAEPQRGAVVGSGGGTVAAAGSGRRRRALSRRMGL